MQEKQNNAKGDNKMECLDQFIIVNISLYHFSITDSHCESIQKL